MCGHGRMRDFCTSERAPRIKTASRTGGCLCAGGKLHADEGEHGVAEGQDAADDGEAGHHGDEGREADPQEEQPQAPTRDRFGKTDIHCKLSFEELGLGAVNSDSLILLNPGCFEGLRLFGVIVRQFRKYFLSNML